MKNPILIVLLVLISAIGTLGATDIEGNTTLSGSNGYIVIPSAYPVTSGESAAITTGYHAVLAFPKDFSHIPFIQFGFKEDFEVSLAVDIADTAALLLQTKWRFIEKNTTSVAFGINGQMHNIGGTALEFAGQTYIATSFASNFIDLPSKTTILVGYTVKDGMNSDIDFGMGFQAPLWEKVFKGKVDFMIDFGNVSYSIYPSAGNAGNRGMLNIGMRLLPIEFMKSTYVTADLRLLDILDQNGRGLSAGISISFRP
jgi:hypothetical protein